MEHETRNIIEVSAGLIFRGGKLLITQRHKHSHLGGLWEFPGGKREPEESFEQCLFRELREELGIEVTVGELFDSVVHTYPEKTVSLRFYLCAVKSGEPQPLDCAACKWVTQDELASHEFPAADAALLTKLCGGVRLWQQT